MRTRFGLCALAAITFASICSVAKADTPPTTFYVSLSGDDANPGSFDAPFRNLSRARNAVRALAHPITNSVMVVIRGGTYYIESDPGLSGGPLVLSGTPDSGASSSLTVGYSAYPGEHVVISGGRVLTGYATGTILNASRNYTFHLGNVAFPSRDLYNDDARLTPARTPDTGDLPTTPAWTTITAITNATTIEVAAPTGNQLSSRNPYLEIVARRRFVSPRQRIVYTEDLSDGRHVVHLQGPFGSTGFSNIDLEVGDQVYIEGGQNLMDRAFEWHYSAEVPTDGQVALRLPSPPGGPEMTPGVVVAPVLETLVDMDNVQYVQFFGLNFAHTNRPTFADPRWYDSIGAGVSAVLDNSLGLYRRIVLPGAIHFQATRYCSINFCTVAHTGASGIVIESEPLACNTSSPIYASHNTIANTEVYDIGGNAIQVGPTPWPCGPDAPPVDDTDGVGTADPIDGGPPVILGDPTDALSPLWVDYNAITSCYVHDFGRVFHDAVGVLVRRSRFTSLIGNEICYGPAVGLQLGTQYDPGHPDYIFMVGSYVGDNDIHHVVQMLSDGGGLYAVSRDDGGVIERNHFHDIVWDPRFNTHIGAPYGFGIYFDQVTRAYTVRFNVTDNVPSPTFVNPMAGTLNTFGTNYFDNRYQIVNVNGGIAETTIGATARYFESLNPLNEASWIAVLRRTTRP